MSRFQFVADHLDTYPVKWLCAVVEVARSSFYAWLDGADARAAKAAADEALAARIRTVHDADNTYGAPRITAELNDGVPDGERVNHKRVARVMRGAGIACAARPLGRRTRNPVANHQPDPGVVGDRRVTQHRRDDVGIVGSPAPPSRSPRRAISA